MPFPTALIAETEQFFHEQIPLTRAMGVRVAAYDETGLTLSAPLKLNYNHLGTAFGGSLNALAFAAGYGLLWLAVKESHSCHLVVRESSTSFIRPVRKDLLAFCPTPEEAALATFKRDFGRKGKARIALEVRFEEEGELAVQFRGMFVALK